MSVVEVMNNGYSREATLMYLLRCMFYISEHYQFIVEGVHIPGIKNMQADALSCNCVPSFLQMTPSSTAGGTDPRKSTDVTGGRTWTSVN